MPVALTDFTGPDTLGTSLFHDRCINAVHLPKNYGRWLEIGKARLDSDGTIHVFLDRTLIGGFNGYAYLAPIGVQPPPSEPEPKRPNEPSDDEI